MALMDSVNGLLGRVSDPRVSGGLLALGSSLLQGRGNLAQSLGQGAQQLQQFNASYDQNQQEQQFQQGRQQLQQQQIAQGQYQQEQQAAQVKAKEQRMAQIQEALKDAPPFIQQIAAGDPEAAFNYYTEFIAQQQKPAEAYTLSEGQTRFGPDGKPIASVRKTFAPQAPQRETFGAPIDRIGPDGRPVTVQIGSFGTPRIVDGFSPINPASGGLKASDLPATAKSAALAFNQLDGQLKAMRENIKKGGTAFIPSEREGALKTEYQSLIITLKNMAELGALAGPDVAILEGMVSNPTSLMANLKGKDRVVAQIDALQGIVNRNRQSFVDTYGQAGQSMLKPSTGLPAAGFTIKNGKTPAAGGFKLLGKE